MYQGFSDSAPVPSSATPARVNSHVGAVVATSHQARDAKDCFVYLASTSGVKICNVSRCFLYLLYLSTLYI